MTHDSVTLPAPQRGGRRSRVAAPEQGPTVSTGAWLVHALTLLVGAAVLVRVNWGQWFFGDDWEFIVSRGLGDDTVDTLLRPHNEHWSTIPILIYRGLLEVFGLRSHLPFIGVLIVLHLALAHVLWRVCLRNGSRPAVATALVAPFIVLGVGSENLLWAFQIGFVGSVLLGYLAVLAADDAHGGWRRLALAWALAIGALMCSGIGVVFVGAAVLTAWMRQGLLRAVLVGSVPAAAFSGWYLIYGRGAAGAPKQDSLALLERAHFIERGLTASLDGFVGASFAGLAILALLAGWLVGTWSVTSRTSAAAVAAGAGAVALYLLVSFGRVSLGVGASTASRYAYISIALLLPLLSLALSRVLSRLPDGVLVVVAGVIGTVLVGQNLAELRRDALFEQSREALMRREVLAATELAASGESTLTQQPDPAFNPDITMTALADFRERGWLTRDEGVYGAKDLLTVRARTQVQMVTGAAASGAPSDADVVGTGRVAVVDAGAGCAVYTPTGTLAQVAVDPVSAGPMRLSVTASSTGQLGVALADLAQAGAYGAGTSVGVTAGTPSQLLIAAPEVRVTLTLPDGPTRLCLG